MKRMRAAVENAKYLERYRIDGGVRLGLTTAILCRDRCNNRLFRSLTDSRRILFTETCGIWTKRPIDRRKNCVTRVAPTRSNPFTIGVVRVFCCLLLCTRCSNWIGAGHGPSEASTHKREPGGDSFRGIEMKSRQSCVGVGWVILPASLAMELDYCDGHSFCVLWVVSHWCRIYSVPTSDEVMAADEAELICPR